MKLSITLFSFFIITNLFGQNLIVQTFGNGYEFEVAVAMQAFSCIQKNCIKGMKRTKFIDSLSIINFKELENQKRVFERLNPEKRFNRIQSFQLDSQIPELTFYRNLLESKDSSILLQIKLVLSYKSGLLSCEEISIANQERYKYPRSDYWYEFNTFTNSGNNIPYPPPPPPSPPQIYKASGINLCPSCIWKKQITIDNQRNYWLNQKHKYDVLSNINGHQLRAVKNGYHGVINFDNEVIIPIEFDSLELFSNFYIQVWKDGLTGLYNFSGKLLLEPKYEAIKVRSIYSLKKSGTIITLDKIIPIYLLKSKGLMGVQSYKGEILVPFVYDSIELNFSRYFKVKKGDSYGLLSQNSDIIFPIKYSAIDHISSPWECYELTTNKGKTKTRLVLKNPNSGKLQIIKLK